MVKPNNSKHRRQLQKTNKQMINRPKYKGNVNKDKKFKDSINVKYLISNNRYLMKINKITLTKWGLKKIITLEL